MQKLNKIINISPLISLIFVSIVFGVLIFGMKKIDPMYGDSGLMYLQTKQIVDSNFTTFSFDYKGRVFDKEGRYAPYKKPFIGKVKDKYYIDFPPYFPLVNSIFYKFVGIPGLYFLPFLSLIATLYLIYRIGKMFDLHNWHLNFLLILYAFCTTVPLYNFIYHEYPIAILFFTVSIFYLMRLFIVFQNNSKMNYILFGFFAGVSIFFRLELVFVYISMGVSFIYMKRSEAFRMILISSIGFLFPFILLLLLNFHTHNHPLGLRYLLTLENTNTDNISNRINIIYMMLFSPLRGIFYQSPVTILSIFLFFFLKNISDLGKFLFYSIIFSFLLILFFSPNDGDHIAPRYLFGTFPLFCIFLVKLISEMKISKNQNLIILITLFSVIFSFVGLYKNIRWLSSSDKNVSIFNSKLNKVAEEIIIFREYASPLNLQNSYSSRIFMVAENDEDLEKIVLSLREQKADRFVIAENVLLTELNKKDQNKNLNDGKNKYFLKELENIILISKSMESPFLFYHYKILK